MGAMEELRALFEQLKDTPTKLQEKMPNLKADMEAQLKWGLERQAEAEAYMKRRRGEEVESDKEKEGDLDTVPDRFEAERAPKEEEVLALVQLLRQVVEPEREQLPPPSAKPRR